MLALADPDDESPAGKLKLNSQGMGGRAARSMVQHIHPYNKRLPSIQLRAPALRLIASICGFDVAPRLHVTRRFTVNGFRRGAEYDARQSTRVISNRCGVEVNLLHPGVLELLLGAGITPRPEEQTRYGRIQYVAYATEASTSKNLDPQRKAIVAVDLFGPTRRDGRVRRVDARERHKAFLPLACLGRMVGFGPEDNDFEVFELHAAYG